MLTAKKLAAINDLISQRKHLIADRDWVKKSPVLHIAETDQRGQSAPRFRVSDPAIKDALSSYLQSKIADVEIKLKVAGFDVTAEVVETDE